MPAKRDGDCESKKRLGDVTGCIRPCEGQGRRYRRRSEGAGAGWNMSGCMQPTALRPARQISVGP